MKTDTRKTISLWIILTVTVFALYNSYYHGVQMVRRHEPEGSPLGSDWIIAAFPEPVLIACILRGFDLRSAVAGSVMVGWILWVNVSATAGGPAGLIVALAPPTLALLCLWLTDHDMIPAPVKRRSAAGSRAKATAPKVQVTGVIDLPQGSNELASDPGLTLESGSTEQGQTAKHGSKLTLATAWTLNHVTNDRVPSVAEIVAATGASESTAKRARGRVNASKTDKAGVLQNV